MVEAVFGSTEFALSTFVRTTMFSAFCAIVSGGAFVVAVFGGPVGALTVGTDEADFLT